MRMWMGNVVCVVYVLARANIETRKLFLISDWRRRQLPLHLQDGVKNREI